MSVWYVWSVSLCSTFVVGILFSCLGTYKNLSYIIISFSQNTRKRPNSIISGFFKKVNQKVNLRQCPPTCPDTASLRNDFFFENSSKKRLICSPVIRFVYAQARQRLSFALKYGFCMSKFTQFLLISHKIFKDFTVPQQRPPLHTMLTTNYPKYTDISTFRGGNYDKIVLLPFWKGFYSKRE